MTILTFLPFAYGFIAAFVYRWLLKTFVKKPKGQVGRSKHNIGSYDRLLRAAIGIGLFVLAVMNGGSASLLFWSGFSIFEAMFSWCGFYAAIGRNTCPLE